MRTQAPTSTSQRGVATLVVAIILLIAATFLTFFAAKVGMQEQRMAGNDRRQKDAFAVSEALMERAGTFLNANSANFGNWAWLTCSSAAMPCGDGTTTVYNNAWRYVAVRTLATVDGTGTSGDNALGTLNGQAYYLTRNPTATGGSTEPVVIVASGIGDDGTGTATVRQVEKRVFTMPPGQIPPLTAPAVGVLGSFNLVGNPNSSKTLEELLQITPQNCDNTTSGSGQLLSVWTNQNFNTLVNGVASWDICQAQFFKTNTDTLLSGNSDCFLGTQTSGCGCQSTQDPLLSVCRSQDFSNSTDPNKLTMCGIKDADSNFPADLFQWVFGAPPADVKARADQVLANCSSLSASSTGLIWVTGDCNPSANQVGSRTNPVMLVVEGEIDFGANDQVWGLVVGHNSPKVKLGGGFTIHGAMVVDSAATVFQASGTYNAIYDPCVFAAFYNNKAFVEYAPVEGGWSDHL